MAYVFIAAIYLIGALTAYQMGVFALVGYTGALLYLILTLKRKGESYNDRH